MQLGDLFKYFTYQLFAPGVLLRETYEAFKKVLECDKEGLELIAGIEDLYHDRKAVDIALVRERTGKLSVLVKGAVDNLIKMSPLPHLALQDYFKKIDFYVTLSLSTLEYEFSPPFVLSLDEIPQNSERLVGGKASHLARARQELSLPTPAGFAITSRACNYFCEYNGLRSALDSLLATADISSPARLESLSSGLQALVMKAVVPPDIDAALRQGLRGMSRQGKTRTGLAVRSSAVGEDSRLSFAGQYKTLLGVAPEDAAQAYKQILASKYSAPALAYRISNGMLDSETPMAVLFLEMLDAGSSGVVYTRDPADEAGEALAIYSLWGLGEPLVSGETSPDVTVMSREAPHPVLEQRTGARIGKTMPSDKGGTMRAGLDENETRSFSLPAEDALRLAEWSLRIESLFGGPQDIEWCRDRDDALYVLQARPLRTRGKTATTDSPPSPPAHYEVLLRSGERAAGGAGGGPVFVYGPGSDLNEMPPQSVLVAQTASPALARVAARMSAAITEHGSVAGHLASVARELGIPLVVNAVGATGVLKTGDLVTVHADECVVYRGIAADLIARSRNKKDLEDTPFRKRFRAALDFISPLTMIDPASPTFKPEGCKTLHDILRYVHEKAVHEMFFAAGRGAGSGKGVKRLDAGLPLALYLLDLGGGLGHEALQRDVVRLDDVLNPSLGAVFAGMSHPAIHWPPELQHFDWQGLESAASGAIMSLDAKALASYILVSPVYLNLNMRFGYHFAMVDVMCVPRSSGNHVLFRYKGGGAGYDNRRRRVEFLGQVLSAHGFEVSITGDLIDAGLKRVPRKTLLEKMEIVGALLGSTRMLDMSFDDDGTVNALAERFLKGDYDLGCLGKGRNGHDGTEAR